MILRKVARPLLGSIFIAGGVNTLLAPHAEEPATEPDADVKLDSMIKITAGAALAFSVLPRIAALVLASKLVPATLAGHRFWEHEDPKERSAEEVQFLKNLGLLGGLLLASADTRGKPSLRWRAKRAAGRVGDRLP
jgi:putative oxidoreductase